MEISALIQQSVWGSESDATAFQGSVTQRFLNMECDCFSFTFKRQTHAAFTDLISAVRNSLPGRTRVQAFGSRRALLSLHQEETFFTLCDNDVTSTAPWEICGRDFVLTGHGDLELIRKVHECSRESIKESATPKLVWEYLDGSTRARRTIQPAKARSAPDAFYPWLGGVDGYYTRYMASESPILVLLGPPGTAKTSFIRNLIWRDGLSTIFTYDEDLLKSDAMFVDFITGDSNLLVVEDADTFLTDRDHGGNHLMAKFLNISDGLAAGVRRKKIIFTANIMEPTRIDSALLRPGRCFDCQLFRKLTFDEAVLAAKAAHLPLPVEPKFYTLAEIFAGGRNEPVGSPGKRVGF